MIGKGIFGRTFSSLLRYVSNERVAARLLDYMTSDGHMIGAMAYRNLAATTPQGAACEMDFVARQSRKIAKPVFHLILSLHPSEKMEPARLIAASECVVERLGLGDHQAVYAVHLEKQHLHCHVAINRVGARGMVWAMWRSATRIPAACREVEREMGLTPHEAFLDRSYPKSGPVIRSVHPSGWTPQECRVYERAAVKPGRVRRQLAKAEARGFAQEILPDVGPAFKSASSWEQIHRDLSAAAFRLALYENGRRRGLQVLDDYGKRTAASHLDSAYGLQKLESRLGPFFTPERYVATEVIPTILKPLSSRSPDDVAAAEDRLLRHYLEKTQPARRVLADALEKSRVKEKLAKAGERQTLREVLERIGAPGSRKPEMSAMRQLIVEEYQGKLQAIRSHCRDERRLTRKRFAVLAWIEYLIEQTKKFVHDAIVVLAWFRGHLDGISRGNRLVSATEHRWPPEALGYHAELTLEERSHYGEHYSSRQRMLAFARAAGISPAVTSNGAVEYRNRQNRIVFVDRGHDILVVGADSGYIEREPMRLALQYGEYKWGASSACGDFYFTETAISVASQHRIKLKERFSDLSSDRPRAGDNNRTSARGRNIRKNIRPDNAHRLGH